MLGWTVAMPAETQLSLNRMILGGAFDRLPATCASASPWRRVASPSARPARERLAPSGHRARALQRRRARTWTASTSTPRCTTGRALRYLVDVMGPSSVLLGSDYPFPLGESTWAGHPLVRLPHDVEGRLLGGSALDFLDLRSRPLEPLGRPMADVGIAGAGLAGPLLADRYLCRRGHDVTLYERRPDPAWPAAAGRSINLALSAAGIDALERVGLADDVMGHGLAMRGRMMHDRSGQLAYQAYSADGSKAISSISRHGLNGLLLDAAAKEPGVVLQFEERAVAVVAETGELTWKARAAATPSPTRWSSVPTARAARCGKPWSASERRHYRREHLPWGYKELTIAPDASGGFAQLDQALHIWPRGASMMIALPNSDHSFTATLFWPFDGDAGFAGLDTPAAVRARFDRDYPDATERFEDLAGEFARNPVGLARHRAGLAVGPVPGWALLGGAAHAIVPFFGQGMNCAFEDVVELDRCLGETADDWRGRASPRTPSGASPTPTPSPSSRSTTSWRCGTRCVAGLPARQAGRARHRAVGAGPLRLLVRAGELHHRPCTEARRRAAAQRRFPANVAALDAAAGGRSCGRGAQGRAVSNDTLRALRRRGGRPPRPAPPPQLRGLPRARRRP